MVSLGEQCPSIDSYYTLRRRIARYEEETGVDLFEKCFKGITRKQALEYGSLVGDAEALAQYFEDGEFTALQRLDHILY